MRMSMHRARRGRRAAVGAVVATMMLSGAGSALAQVPTHRSVESSAKGDPGKPIRLGVYVNVQPDCSSGPLPSIRLVSPPSNGAVQIKRGKVTATNYQKCLALEVPGFVAFYQSKADCAGTDTVTLRSSFRRAASKSSASPSMSAAVRAIRRSERTSSRIAPGPTCPPEPPELTSCTKKTDWLAGP